jgi:amino acid transporter
MKDYFKTHFPLHSETFAPYADLFAMTLCLVITRMLKNLFDFLSKMFFLVLLIVGIKESAVLNNVFTFVNLSVIALVIVVGLTKIQGHNWNISPNEVKMIDESYLNL